VKAATAAAGGSAATLSALTLVLLTQFAPGMTIENRGIIAAAVPGALTAALTFYAGWKAKHQVRPPVPAVPSNVTITPVPPMTTIPPGGVAGI
jgi:hypothetical protein